MVYAALLTRPVFFSFSANRTRQWKRAVVFLVFGSSALYLHTNVCLDIISRRHVLAEATASEDHNNNNIYFFFSVNYVKVDDREKINKTPVDRTKRHAVILCTSIKNENNLRAPHPSSFICIIL